MSKTTSIGLMVISVLLFVMGVQAYLSTASAVSRSMTGAPPDSAVWLVISALLVGITALFGFSEKDANRGSAKNSH
jgi:uncharacterized membrane protein YidH (DUF202 family)